MTALELQQRIVKALNGCEELVPARLAAARVRNAAPAVTNEVTVTITPTPEPTPPLNLKRKEKRNGTWHN